MVSSIGVKVLLLAALVAVPFITSSYTAYQLGLYILFGIVGQGIVLCWGTGGCLPMGQALFFGVGAYISGTVLKSDPSWGVVIWCRPTRWVPVTSCSRTCAAGHVARGS